MIEVAGIEYGAAYAMWYTGVYSSVEGVYAAGCGDCDSVGV